MSMAWGNVIMHSAITKKPKRSATEQCRLCQQATDTRAPLSKYRRWSQQQKHRCLQLACRGQADRGSSHMGDQPTASTHGPPPNTWSESPATTTHSRCAHKRQEQRKCLKYETWTKNAWMSGALSMSLIPVLSICIHSDVALLWLAH